MLECRFNSLRRLLIRISCKLICANLNPKPHEAENQNIKQKEYFLYEKLVVAALLPIRQKRQPSTTRVFVSVKLYWWWVHPLAFVSEKREVSEQREGFIRKPKVFLWASFGYFSGQTENVTP